MAHRLSQPLFAITSALIEEETGLHYDLDDADLFGQKLVQRATDRGFESLLDYYYFLRYDEHRAAELQSLVELLVVHETYFFREAEALVAIIDQTFREFESASGKLRIWSAACATGEEPLTLAMLLDERRLLGRVEIVATDISERALQRAHSAIYCGRSLRAVSAAARRMHFVEVGDGCVRVRDELRSAITWRKVNLLDVAAVEALGSFHAIVCRNVLIYFADSTVASVVSRLANSLHPGGPLLVGTSESLLRFGTSLVCEERGGAFFYVRGS